MRILITSGGTKVRIDSVRHIGNMSSGTFGSRIANSLMFCTTLENYDKNDHITFLKAKGSKTPCISEFFDNRNYTEIDYDDFYDYADKLESLCKQDFDIVVLAAAVSDYLVDNPVDGKIRSRENFEIKLKPAPKLINKIKQWSPNTKLVGFKLLVGSDREELIEASLSSIIENQCDMMIANDLKDIKGNNHKVMVIADDKIHDYEASTAPNDCLFLAKRVAEHILKLKEVK